MQDSVDQQQREYSLQGMKPIHILRPEGPAAVGKRRRAVGRSIRKLRREWTALFGDLNDPFTWLKIGA